ncbi:hypothetical protein HN958_03140, partial [Candidatus Falkowbacteria bacterium]|nr:hypothetical protein [Candidatus Falkowbacteria bacterium]
MINKLNELKSKAVESIEKAKTVEALEKIDNTLMGRKVGKLNDILKGIKDLSA